jgi:hypothetical protein
VAAILELVEAVGIWVVKEVVVGEDKGFIVMVIKGMEVDDFTGFSVVDEIDLVGSPFKLEFTDRNATTWL